MFKCQQLYINMKGDYGILFEKEVCVDLEVVPMKSTFYHFKIGNFNCTSINDGGHDYHLSDMFSNVPLEQVEQVLGQRGLPTDHLYTLYACLYVDTGSNRIWAVEM